ncbi:lysophospholipase L1-like esterase [Roseimicrobium gellanilyticum]|uniref:Lysophospholipase L1-like esterase n=1 Tax=Roseimicrobium gellanilyticum TaxID=748857 RepID=A0A366HQG3_9BACT|nr:rhamnogalacturonan acetylesterase [Roseimicrobium gellanilyticum]RBP45892.1 lysophospholipase L1-like esterase [Roseimicrobium gellanilyticum]
MFRRTLLSLALCSLATVAHSNAAESKPVASQQGDKASSQIRVVLAGDSTVTDTAGWGAAFARLLKTEVECVNLASSGQSSKSFRDGGRWKKVLEANPTFVLIQFGHNDMPGKGPNRETDPATTYRANLIACIREARDIGAQPILVTSVARRVFDNGKLRGELKPYAEAMKQVAVDEKVPLVDLFSRSMILLQEMGPAKADEFNPPHPKPGTTDRTHLNAKGAEVFAAVIAEELKRVSPEAGRLLR